jgi:hypothetical protein
MSRKKPRKALKDPNTVHQARLSDGRVVEWTGNDDSRYGRRWLLVQGEEGHRGRRSSRKGQGQD